MFNFFNRKGDKIMKKILLLVASLAVFIAGGVVHADTTIQESDGIFYAWGDNDYGQLGTGNTDYVPESNKINLAQIAMYPQSPNYDAAGKIVKALQLDGAIIVIDAYGSIWTSGRNNLGQLGRGLSENENATKFVKVSGKYTFSDFNILSNKIVGSIKGRTGEFMTWGEGVPDVDYLPTITSSFINSIPMTSKINYPLYYKTNGSGNVIESLRYEGYDNFNFDKKMTIFINQSNADVTIGKNNSIFVETYSAGKTTSDALTQYFYSSNSSVVSAKQGRANLILAKTTYDSVGKKATQVINYYAKSGFVLKYFEPKFQAANNAEQSEYIVDYTAGDGSRKEYLKTYDGKGLIYNYSPDWTPNRGPKGGIWVSMTETNYDVNGKKTLFSDSKYNQDMNNRRNYQNIKWFDVSTGQAVKLAAQWFYDLGAIDSMGDVTNPVQQKYQATQYVNGKSTKSQLQYYNELGGQTLTVSAEYETQGAYVGNTLGYFYKYLDGSQEAKNDQNNHLKKTVNLKFSPQSAVSYSYDPTKLYNLATYKKITDY